MSTQHLQFLLITGPPGVQVRAHSSRREQQCPRKRLLILHSQPDSELCLPVSLFSPPSEWVLGVQILGCVSTANLFYFSVSVSSSEH